MSAAFRRSRFTQSPSASTPSNLAGYYFISFQLAESFVDPGAGSKLELARTTADASGNPIRSTLITTFPFAAAVPGGSVLAELWAADILSAGANITLGIEYSVDGGATFGQVDFNPLTSAIANQSSEGTITAGAGFLTTMTKLPLNGLYVFRLTLGGHPLSTQGAVIKNVTYNLLVQLP